MSWPVPINKSSPDYQDPALVAKYNKDRQSCYIGNGCEVSIFPNRGSFFCLRCCGWYFGEIEDHIKTDKHYESMMEELGK